MEKFGIKKKNNGFVTVFVLFAIIPVFFPMISNSVQMKRIF